MNRRLLTAAEYRAATGLTKYDLTRWRHLNDAIDAVNVPSRHGRRGTYHYPTTEVRPGVALRQLLNTRINTHPAQIVTDIVACVRAHPDAGPVISYRLGHRHGGDSNVTITINLGRST